MIASNKLLRLRTAFGASSQITRRSVQGFAQRCIQVSFWPPVPTTGPPDRHSFSMSQEPASLQQLLLSGARMTRTAQLAWTQVLDAGDTVVDATCGNGRDTLFLAKAVGPCGHVHAFDIQGAAVEATRRTLQALPAEERPQATLHQCCHSRMAELIPSATAKLITFNLGYLPWGDKALTTSRDTTLAAVEAALQVVCPGGMVSVLAYTGHPGGLEEYDAIHELAGKLTPSHWVCSEVRSLNRPAAPVLILIWRQQQVMN